MSSFKFYLVSNACPEVYPNNTPSDFRTSLNNPLELEGKWEVGLESICYSAEIEDYEEDASITMYTCKYTYPIVNDSHKFRYFLTGDNQWMGHKGITPASFEEDQTNLSKICDTLNDMGNTLTSTTRPFYFARNAQGALTYKCYDSGLFLSFSPHMSDILGLDSNTTLGYYTSANVSEFTYDFDVKAETFYDAPLTQEDYTLRYAHVGLQKALHVITVKEFGESFNGTQEGLRRLIQEKLPFPLDVAYGSDRLVLTNLDEDYTFDFSPMMRLHFNLKGPLIGKNNLASSKPFKWSDMPDVTHEHWYITVYGTAMKTLPVYECDKLSIPLSPFKYATVSDLLNGINNRVKSELKHALKGEYQVERHKCTLNLLPSKHAVLTLGERIQVQFSDNLCYLLGFPYEHFSTGTVIGQREVDVLFNRSRQLHVLTNIIQPTTVGQQQVHILRDFVHTNVEDQLNVKNFDIISYVPLQLNSINDIHIQIVNSLYEPVKLKEMKTLLVLYFRKI